MFTNHAQSFKRLPSWIYKLGAQVWIDYEFPRHLFIETTASCNLSCAYCPREKESSSMDFGLFRKIIDEAAGYGPRSFSLHLFGEPLLYPRIFEAIKYIKKSNSRNTVLITTNGTLLNECVDDFVSSGIDQAYWTWRREARFNERTLLKLKAWGRFRIRFIDEITPESAREEWKDWKNVEGRHLHNYGGRINTLRWQVKDDRVTPKRWPCYHLFYAPAVAWNGDILICCADSNRKSRIGTFPEISVAQAWQSQIMGRLRKEQLNGTYSGICQSCNIWKQYPNIFWGHEHPIKENKGI